MSREDALMVRDIRPASRGNASTSPAIESKSRDDAPNPRVFEPELRGSKPMLRDIESMSRDHEAKSRGIEALDRDQECCRVLRSLRARAGKDAGAPRAYRVRAIAAS